VVDGKLKLGADVRKLEHIIKNPTALKTLKKQNVESAMSIVGKADPTADSDAFRKFKQAATLLEKLPSKELQRLRESEPTRLILQDLFVAVRNAAKAAGVKLS
jgi:hypothetical protein